MVSLTLGGLYVAGAGGSEESEEEEGVAMAGL